MHTNLLLQHRFGAEAKLGAGKWTAGTLASLFAAARCYVCRNLLNGCAHTRSHLVTVDGTQVGIQKFLYCPRCAVAQGGPLTLEDHAARCLWLEHIRYRGSLTDAAASLGLSPRTEWTAMVEDWYKTYLEAPRA